MSTSELLQRWSEGSITADELHELTAKLAEPESQSVLLDDWLLESSLAGRLPGVSLAALPEAAGTSRLLKAPELLQARKWSNWLSWRPLAAAAACAAMAFAWWATTRVGEPWAVVSSVKGNLEILGDTRARPVHIGGALQVGDGILVGEGGSAQLVVMGLGLVALGPETCLRRGAEARVLELVSGFIEIEAEKQPRNQPWRIRTPQAEAAVIGTKFTLAAAEDRTALRVSEGLVRLTGLSSGKMEPVGGGSRAFVTADSPPAVAGSRPGSVLLLTSRAAPYPSWDRFNRLISDKLVGARLWRLGFRVDVRHFDEVQASDLRGRALVIVSIFAEGAGESALERIGLVHAGVPVVCLEPAAYPALGMATGGRGVGFDFAQGAAQVHLAAISHSLLSAIGDSTKNWLVTMQGWGCPSPSADTLVSLGDRPDRAVWFAYEVGAPLAGAGGSAPARRIGLFLDPNGIKDSSSPVWQVFEASVDWSVSMESKR